ncbi:MAG: Ig-like domain-containing protein [Clostridiales bacterium]|nr:Ig-like domain-containing protein [Clostridiales bacterium]
MKKFFSVLSVFLCAALLLAQFGAPALASGIITGNDPPDDEDANVNVLTLVKSSVANGARNVPLNPVIQLDFTKNVVNFLTARQNATCYHLVDSDGNSVPIRIIVPDDQMQQDVKRNVFIMPAENLRPDTIYKLAVDNTLISKNGDRIDDAHQIVFKTGTQVSDKANPLLAGLGMNVLTFTNDQPLNENSVPGSSPTSSALSRPAGSNRFSFASIDTVLLSRIVLITAVCALVLIAFLQVRKKTGLFRGPERAYWRTVFSSDTEERQRHSIGYSEKR